jgi:hypothetical protein
MIRDAGPGERPPPARDHGVNPLTTPRRWTHGLIVLGSVLPRLLFAYLRPPDPGWGAYYWPMSSSLLEHGVLGYGEVPSTLYEPLYPLFLAAARYATADHLLGVLALQALLCAVGAIFLYELTLVLTRDERTAAIATALYALYPYFIRQAAALEEVPLFTTLLVACAYTHATADDLRRSLACGFAFGLALLTRTVAAPICALAVLALAARRRFSSALAVGAVAALLCLPYGLRNHRIDGSILPTRAGYNLLKANCKYSERVIPTYTVDVLNPYLAALLQAGLPNAASATEREIDRFYWSRAIAFVRAHPLEAVARWARNAAYLFYPRLVPFHPVGPATTSRFTSGGELAVEGAADRSPVEELAYTASYLPLLVGALAGLYLRRGEVRRDLILYVIVACFAVVHSISWPATRVRSPMDFVLMFYAACAIRRVMPARGRADRLGPRPPGPL